MLLCYSTVSYQCDMVYSITTPYRTSLRIVAMRHCTALRCMLTYCNASHYDTSRYFTVRCITLHRNASHHNTSWCGNSALRHIVIRYLMSLSCCVPSGASLVWLHHLTHLTYPTFRLFGSGVCIRPGSVSFLYTRRRDTHDTKRHHTTPHRVTPHNATSHHATSHHAKSHHATPRHVTSLARVGTLVRTPQVYWLHVAVNQQSGTEAHDFNHACASKAAIAIIAIATATIVTIATAIIA